VYEYRDLSRLTKTAIIVVFIYLLLDMVAATAALIQGPIPPDHLGVAGVLALCAAAGLVTCICVVGRWIYRASANAHAISGLPTISPGWAVGWYFVPVMSLYRPFQAIKKTWFASHQSRDGHDQAAPTLLVIWWTLWIVSNAIGTASFRMSASGAASQATANVLDMAAAVLGIPLCVTLVFIMSEIATAQEAAVA